jgi:uncharacterized protein (TIGR02231 family)
MLLKSISVLSMILLVAIAGYAKVQKKQRLNIETATVFLKGAELTSRASIALDKGENEIMLTNVAGNVSSSSLVIRASNGAVVQSAVFQNNYLEEETYSPIAKKLKDSIETEKKNKADVAVNIAVLTEQIAVLQDNRKVSGYNTGLTVTELAKMLELVSSKMGSYLTAKNKLEVMKVAIDERIAKLELQLEEEQAKGYQPGGQLLVKFYSKEAVTSDITISYLVPAAGWTPSYDIMADDITSPIKLYYKANVFQNSGVDWNNVRLVLSTGNPVEGAEAPSLLPWYLSFKTPEVIKDLQSSDFSDRLGVTSGLYQMQRGRGIEVGKTVITAEEIKISSEGDRQNSSMDKHTSVDNTGVNTTFEIDLPYTITSDSKEQMVAIKKHLVPATYRYYAAPRKDKDAFLQALITNWENLDLLPGQTNVFYEGTYVGQGYLDMRNVKDTMAISLGRDKKIIVKRERDMKLRSVKYIGSNVKETEGYSITVRNTRKQPINIILMDQLPISNDKDIVVEDRDLPDGEYEETTGYVKWTMSAVENVAKVINFSYTVRYPKGKKVNGM